MKILLFCPTHRLEPETLESIMRIDPAGHQLHIMFTRHNPANTPQYNVLYNYRQGRQVALDMGYDAMLCVESDMIVPADTLRRLVRVEADVALGLYVHRHNDVIADSECNPIVWPFEPDIHFLLWLNRYPDLWRQSWGNIVRVSGSGFGCTLIHRKALEAIPFRLVTCDGRFIPAHCDSYFFADLLATDDIVAKVDMSCICGHKRPDGIVLWPTLDGIKTTPGDPSRLYNMESISYGTASSGNLSVRSA